MTGNYNARLSSSTINKHSQRPEHEGMKRLKWKDKVHFDFSFKFKFKTFAFGKKKK